MKKLLLTLAVAAMGFAASAASYEITPGSLTWTAEGKGFSATVTVEGKTFSLTTAKGTYNGNLRNPGGDGEIRMYKGSDLTIASTDFEFTNIKLVASATNYAPAGLTLSEGWNFTVSGVNYNLKSETSQKTVTINATGAQARIKTITVSDESSDTPEPTATSVTSVAATKALATDTRVKVDYALTVGWVKNTNIFACDAAGDFIKLYGTNSVKVGDVIPVGWEATYKLYNNNTPELDGFTELPAATEGTFTPKIVAADAITVDMVNSVVMVKDVVLSEATPAGMANFTGKVGDTELSLRNNYELASVPAGTYDITLVVTVYSGATSLYVTSYNTEIEPEPEPEATTVTSVAATKALATGTKVKVDYALTVGWVKYNNIYACDEAGDFIQLYGKNTLKVGDVIPGGWEATYKYYNNNTPELDGFTELPAATEGTFTPKTVAADAITVDMVNSVVMVKDVVLSEATPAGKANFTGKVGDTELSLRNNYELASVPAGTYDITLVVTVYNGATSLYVTSYNTEIEPEPEPEATTVTSVAATKALATGTKVKVDYALTVGWVKYNNIYACDEAGDFIQLYGKNTLKVGDVIPGGWEATYKYYNNNTPELDGFTELPAATEGTFTPKEVAADAITVDMVNSVILVKNVVLAEDSPAAKANFTGKVGETELSLRNNYELESVPAGTYDITVVVTVYQGATSLYVTNYAAAAGLIGVSVDNEAPVEYFNLQGIRVANPENGIYIRRQGATVTKVAF